MKNNKNDIKSIRCLFIENSKGYGGATYSMLDLVSNLPSEIEPYVISSYPIAELENESYNFEVMPVPVLTELKETGKVFSFIFRLTQAVFKISCYIIKHKIDLVYINNTPCITNYLTSLLTCRRFVIHLRGNYHPTKSNDFIMRRAKKVIAISCWIESQLDFVKDKVTMVYNGVTTDQLVQIPINDVYENSPICISLIGTFAGWKGQKLLLKAIKSVLEQKKNICVRLVGASSFQQQEIEEVEAMIEALQLEEVVEIHPFYHGDEWLSAYRDSDIIIHASTKPEPFGRVIVEGMAAGKVVLASDEGGPKEVITDGVDGYLFKANDTEDLANKIISLVGDYSSLSDLRQAARLKAMQFSPTKCAHNISQVIKEVVNEKLHN